MWIPEHRKLNGSSRVHFKQIYGFKQALTVMSPRELKQMLAGKHKRSWYALLTSAAKVKLPTSPSPLRNLREQLDKFEMIKG